MFSDFDKYQGLNVNDQQDKPIPYKDHVKKAENFLKKYNHSLKKIYFQGNLMWWLTQHDADDQFAILYSDFISVYQNTRAQPTLLESRNVS